MSFAQPPRHNWARTVDNLVGATFATAIVLAVLAWSVVLPTVGLLYSFGVLP